MEVKVHLFLSSGQLHAPAALLAVKQPPVSTAWEAGWAPEPFCTFWTGEKCVATVGIEPRFLGHQAHNMPAKLSSLFGAQRGHTLNL